MKNKNKKNNSLKLKLVSGTLDINLNLPLNNLKIYLENKKYIVLTNNSIKIYDEKDNLDGTIVL